MIKFLCACCFLLLVINDEGMQHFSPEIFNTRVLQLAIIKLLSFQFKTFYISHKLVNIAIQLMKPILKLNNLLSSCLLYKFFFGKSFYSK